MALLFPLAIWTRYCLPDNFNIHEFADAKLANLEAMIQMPLISQSRDEAPAKPLVIGNSEDQFVVSCAQL